VVEFGFDFVFGVCFVIDEEFIYDWIFLINNGGL
jgi:hypothetical protein